MSVASSDIADVDELVRHVAGGDVRAFDRLYDEVSAAVFGLARRIVGDPNGAEDVTQEVFLEVWQQAPRFDAGKGRAKTWIMTLTHRRAVDAVRRREAQKRHDRIGVPDEVDYGEPVDGLIKGEEHIRVRRCLRSMTELQLESVRLAYYQGYTYSEVAALLDKPLPTIKTRLRDGLHRLRECLEGVR